MIFDCKSILITPKIYIPQSISTFNHIFDKLTKWEDSVHTQECIQNCQHNNFRCRSKIMCFNLFIFLFQSETFCSIVGECVKQREYSTRWKMNLFKTTNVNRNNRTEIDLTELILSRCKKKE